MQKSTGTKQTFESHVSQGQYQYHRSWEYNQWMPSEWLKIAFKFEIKF